MIVRWIALALALWALPSHALVCYNCRCSTDNKPACDCTTTVEVDKGSHCTIVEDLHSQDPYIEISSTALDSPYAHIKDPYYILLDESISYNEASRIWTKEAKRITFGCDWDYCNKYTLISALPKTFQLSINETWLTANIYGTGMVSQCRTCSNPICGNRTNPINYNLCASQTCQNSTTVRLRVVHRRPTTCVSSLVRCLPSLA
jgi:hypothetical protein